MKVACDWQAITGPRPTGLGIAVRFLMEALADHAPDVEVLGLRPNAVDAPLSRVPDRLAWEQVRLPLAINRAKRDGAQLAFTPALGAPLVSALPRVAFVHDLIPLRQPEHFTGPARWYWSTLLPATWRRCEALITSNNLIADELAELLAYPRGQIFIAPYYIDPTLHDIASESRTSAEVSRISSGSEVFLTVGSHEPRKNLELPIKALALFNKQHTPARLVITGVKNEHTRSLHQLAIYCGVSQHVEFSGYLDRRQLVARMLTATALIFVSREEGFGLPPLEAQSIGCPAILSDIPVMRAVHADPSRLGKLAPEYQFSPAFVPLDDAEALAAEMARLAVDAGYRDKLKQAGLAYSGTFAPQATASGLLAAFNSVLKS